MAAMARTSSSAPFYLVESRWRRQTFVHETDLAQADLDTTVRHIAEGQYDTGEITAVYFCAPATGVMEDATDRVLKQVAEHLRRTGAAPHSVLANLLDWAGLTFDPRGAE
jgi:hypothetical protein